MNLLKSLYLEHLEEVSFIYERWLWMMRVQQFNWFNFKELEKRLEAHLDGLFEVEDEHALVVCAEQALEGDFGQCYGAFRVLARACRFDVLEDLICRMDLTDTRRMKGIVDALCHEPGEGNVRWYQGDFFRSLLNRDPSRARIAVQIWGFYQLDISADLYEALQTLSSDKDAVLDILDALGRIRPVSGLSRLLKILGDPDGDIVDGAIAALVRIGDRRRLKECRALVEPHAWPALSLGLYGDKETLADVIQDRRQTVLPDHMIAMGLIGDVSFIPDLIDRLNDPSLADHAALALHLMTGMAFYENHVMPDVTSEDDLFSDEEKEAWRNGTLYPDGKIPGRIATRLTHDQKAWEDGLGTNQRTLDPKKCYRMGRPCSPVCLFEQLKSRTIPDLIRQLAYEELVCRYDLDLPFDVRMSTVQQQTIIAKYGFLIEESRAAFTDGDLYYQKIPLNNENILL